MIFTLLTLALPGVAHAVCTSPAGVAGEVRYDLSDRAIEYCNGLNWIGLPKTSANTCVPDSWAARTPSESTTWRSVTYGNGLFVAVASSGTDQVMTSPDGVTWTARTEAQANEWYDVTYGNGLFVAVAQTGISRVMTSPDGTTWTARNVPEANSWRSVAYGNGLFVAVSTDGTNRIMTSPDGTNWTARAAPEANGWRGITYGNGQFVAVATSGTNRVMTSPDGVTWTPRAAAEANSWFSVTYGDGLYAAIAFDGTNRVMTSPDGITWTPRTAAEATTWRDITYANGTFVAVADAGTNRVMLSSDGITWTPQAAAAASTWISVIHANGTLVAVANTGTTRVMTSNCTTGSSYDWSASTPALYVTNPPVSWWDNFGWSVATNGTHIVAGAPGSDVDINAGGIAYILDASDGSVLHTINNPAPGDTDNFGHTSDIDGNLAVISAVYSDIGATDTGRVYVFNVLTGALVSTLINPDPTADDNFGASVSIAGNLIAVGAPYNDNGAANAGSVYVFNATSGALATTIHNPAPGIDDHFGNAVAIDGNLVVVGAADDDPGGTTDAGSIYVFNATTGAAVSTWANPLPSLNDKFGTAVAIDGNIGIAGAGVWAALVSYSFNATTGATIATFTNPDGGSVAYGQSVAIDGEFAVIGAHNNDTGGNNAGSAHLFNVNTGAVVANFYNPEITSGDESLGFSVDIKNGIIVAGAPYDDIGDGDGNSGSFHTFSSRSYCSNPTGPAGEMLYNDDHRVVQWCDGSNWHAAGPVDPTGPTGGCSTPSQGAGFVMFSSTSCTLQYCDGGTWQSMGGMPPDACACDPSTGLWSSHAATEANTWTALAYGEGLFVAGSWGGTNHIMTSPDGITWTPRTQTDWVGTIAYGNGIFVALPPFGGNSHSYTSPDGINWTRNNAVLPAGAWQRLTFGNGLFVAITFNEATNNIATSTDGVNWTTYNVEVSEWFDVTFGNGIFVAVSYTFNATNHILRSTDGVNWTPHSLTGGPQLRGVAYGNGVFVATSMGGQNYTSPDGITWTQHASSPNHGWLDVIFANGKFVSIGGNSTSAVRTSTDGINWTLGTTAEGNYWNELAYGNGAFVAVSGDGTNRVMRATCP